MKGQVVLITGASAGIGAGLARYYSQLGAHVVLTARRIERLQNIVKDLPTEALAVGADVTQDGQMEKAVARAVEKWGRLDVGIANAGFGVVGPFAKLTAEDYRRQFETNIFGVMRTAWACWPELRKTGGRFALIGSVAGYVAAPGASPYSMSKFAVKALADSLYYEWAKEGTSVTLICPGFVASDIRRTTNQGEFREDATDPIPSWLAMPTQLAAKKMVRAIQKRKREVVVTGHGKLLVWAVRHFPGWFAFLVRRTGMKARGEPNAVR